MAFARLRTSPLACARPGSRASNGAHKTACLVEKTGRKHRRVPKGHAGDFRPEVHHRRVESMGRLKALGSRTREIRQRASPGNLYWDRLASKGECGSPTSGLTLES